MVEISRETGFGGHDNSVLEMLSLKCLSNIQVEILSRWYGMSLEFRDLGERSRPENTFFFFLIFIGVQLIYNVVLVSGVQQSESVMHIHISTLFQIVFPYRSLQSTEQSSLCCTVGLYQLSILNIVVCICQSQSPNLSLPPLTPLVTISLFSPSVTLFLFCRQVHLYPFCRLGWRILLQFIDIQIIFKAMIIKEWI